MGNFVDSDCASQPSLHTRVAIKYRIPESGYPMPKTEGVTRAMQANKAKDSRPELLLRKALWAAGIRGYRLHAKHLPGKPDLVFLTRRLAIFAHGCYWHSCPRCAIARPRHNASYWSEKLAGNSRCDARNAELLREQGLPHGHFPSVVPQKAWHRCG